MTTWSRSWYVFNKPIALLTVSVLLIALCVYRTRRNRRRTPKLAGPPCKSFLFGATQEIFTVPDLGALYADWENNYGPVYEIPFSLGSKVLVLGDPKGIAHLCANDTATYQQFRFGKAFSRRFVRFFIFRSLFASCSHKLVLLVRRQSIVSRRGNSQEVCYVLFYGAQGPSSLISIRIDNVGLYLLVSRYLRSETLFLSSLTVLPKYELSDLFHHSQLTPPCQLASEWNSLLESQSREKMTTDVQEW